MYANREKLEISLAESDKRYSTILLTIQYKRDCVYNSFGEFI